MTFCQLVGVTLNNVYEKKFSMDNTCIIAKRLKI